jgi:hypothetical protein
MRPDYNGLVHVKTFEGKSLIAEMLGDAEMATLKNVLTGTEYQGALNKQARTVLDHDQKALEDKGLTSVKPIIPSC